MANPIDSLLETPDVVTQLAMQYGPRLLAALLVLVAGFFVMHWVAKFAARGLGRLTLEPPVRDLLLRVVRIVVFFLFLLLALQNLGIDLLPLLAGLGIAGAGIALALQGVLGNLAAGLTIIFTRPFRVGEYISIAGEEGVVGNISIFSTTLRHSDLSLVVIPNRKIAGEILHNYGEIRQLNLSVNVAYGTDIQCRRWLGPRRARVQSSRAAGSCTAGGRCGARRSRHLDRHQALGEGPGFRCRRWRDQRCRRRRIPPARRADSSHPGRRA